MGSSLPRKLRCLVFCCAVCLCFSGIRAQSTSSPTDTSSSAGTAPVRIDVSAYIANLDNCAESIEQNRHQPPRILQLRKSIPAEWAVHTSDGDITVSNEWLRSELWSLEHRPKESDKIAAGLVQHLAALRAAAQHMDSQPSAQGGARAQLERVLARREFRELAGPGALQKFVARVEQWLFDKFVRLLRRLHINAKAGNVIAWAVIGLALALLCYWVWKRLRPSSPPAKAPSSAMDSASKTSRQWLDEALAAAERGDYREAIHCSYWAAITRLEDSGVLTRDRARTPRESLRQLDSRPNDQKTLRDLTRHFELVWYGYRPASAADWSGARTQLEQMGCLKASIEPTANS